MEVHFWWRLVPLCGLVGFAVGCLGPDLGLYRGSGYARTYEPAAYRMPPAKGMADLRMAMVHDVLCERYRRHGPAWDRVARAEAEARIAAAPADLDAYDDAAMAAERLDDRVAAEALLRRKAALQGLVIPVDPRPIPCAVDPREQSADELDAGGQALSPLDRARYRTLANLGTVLLHAAMPRVLRGDAQALPVVRQGLACLQDSVRIDPSAHFGRERWQIVAVEHLLAAARDPGLLRRFDLIGDQLDGAPEHDQDRRSAWRHTKLFSGRRGLDLRFTAEFTQARADAEVSRNDRLTIRSHVQVVGGHPDWVAAVAGSRRCGAAFDEPVLGILGMWTLGGGASPHFALCLAAIMERTGQGSIAWEAYERAAALAGKYSPEPDTQVWLISHCRARQEAIAKSRGGEPWQRAMRAGMEAELASALAVRKDFQQWEEQRLAQGGALVDQAAEDAWWSQRPPLGSPTGTVDERHAMERDRDFYQFPQGLLLMVFALGVSSALAFLGSGRLRETTTPAP